MDSFRITKRVTTYFKETLIVVKEKRGRDDWIPFLEDEIENLKYFKDSLQREITESKPKV